MTSYSPVKGRESQSTMQEDYEALLPTVGEAGSFVLSNRTAWLATFVAATTWFAFVVRLAHQHLIQVNGEVATNEPSVSRLYSMFQPRADPSPSASAQAHVADQEFILVCAIVHTLIVCVGSAAGFDTLRDTHWGQPLLRMTVVSFCVLCAALWWSWEYQVGPAPAYLSEGRHWSERFYILSGAVSMTGWLAFSMLMPHSSVGRRMQSSRLLHCLVAVLGTVVYYFDYSLTSVVAFYSIVGASAMMPTTANRVRIDAWNM